MSQEDQLAEKRESRLFPLGQRLDEKGEDRSMEGTFQLEEKVQQRHPTSANKSRK